MGRGGESHGQSGMPEIGEVAVSPLSGGKAAPVSDLREQISEREITLIFGNKDRKSQYLLRHPRAKLDQAYCSFDVKSKKAFAQALAKTPAAEIDQLIQDLWRYPESKQLLREMFVKSEKYRRGLRSRERMTKIREQMTKAGLQPGEWPYRASTVDQHAARITRKSGVSDAQMRREFRKASDGFMLQKLYTTARGDLIERLVFEAHEDIVPTFTDSNEADFFIGGVRYDQKVSRSVGEAFKREHGDSWREKALSDPAALARSLYENQDEQRFDAKRRLFVVFLDGEEDVEAEDLEAAIKRASLDSKPLDIEFNFNGHHHQTQAYMILVTSQKMAVAA